MSSPARATHKQPGRRFAPLVECTILLAVCAGINLLWFTDDPAFVGLRPHPTLFICLLIAVRYGLVAGIEAVGVATVFHSFLLLAMANEPTFLYLLEAPYSTPIVVLIPTTVLVGLLVQRHMDLQTKTGAELAAVAAQNAALKQDQAHLRDANVGLAEQVVGAEGTLSTLYRYAKELNVTEVDGVYRGLASMLRDVIEVEQISVWRIAGATVEVALSQGPGQGANLTSILTDERLDAHFDKDGILTLHDVPDRERTEDLPYLVGKLREGKSGRLHAYLCVEAMPFARYNAGTIRLFSIAVDWASTSLGNALTMHRLATPRPDEAPAAEAVLAAAPPPPPSALAATARDKARPASELSGLLAEADDLLEGHETSARPGESRAPAARRELEEALERATLENPPLRRLLGEVADYLEASPRKTEGP